MARWRLRLFWAAFLAILTAWGVKAYLNSLQQSEPVVVATRDIPVRAVVSADMVKTVPVGRKDRDQFAKDAFHSTSDVTGRYARHAIASGEVLRNRPGDFAAPGEVRSSAAGSGGAMADFLPANTRAVTLKVDPQGVLGKNLRQGDWVDVIFTSKSDSTGGVYASLIVQQAQVLEIERRADAGPDEGILVTLRVTPEQAVDLALAKRTGTVDLALNPPEASDSVKQRVVSPLKFTGQTDAQPGKAESRFKEPENAKPSH